MAHTLIYAPNPIFSQKAEPVVSVDDNILGLVKDMFDVMYQHQGVGVGANMVGALKRVIVLDVSNDGKPNPMAMINPEIITSSEETQTYEEASLSFPGISAKVTRPARIAVQYLDVEGKFQAMEADGDLATVIQHEMDYLDGTVFLDHLSRLKRDSLIKKMIKYKDKHHIDCKHHHHHHH